MNKNILCIIDFSESSIDALKCAADLSTHYKTPLSVVYPYRLVPGQQEDAATVKKKNEAIAKKKFETIEQEVLNGKNLQVSFSPEIGFISDRIQDFAKKNTLLFVVMGKRMNSNTEENIMETLSSIKVPLVLLP